MVNICSCARASGTRVCLLTHGMQVVSVAYTVDGSLLISASADASIRVWDAAASSGATSCLAVINKAHKFSVKPHFLLNLQPSSCQFPLRKTRLLCILRCSTLTFFPL